MLATLEGFLALLLGLSLLVLPLVVTELSRPRDSAWGAVVLLLGLVLVTSAERLTGAPMLAVLCGGLLVGRLGSEVAQARWRALSDEERLALRSADRWSRSLNQLAAAAASLLQSTFAVTAAGSAWLAERRQGRSHGKRWVRAETSEPAAASGSPAPVAAAGSGQSEGEAQPAGSPQPDALSTSPASVATSASAAPAVVSEPRPAAEQPDQADSRGSAAEALSSRERNPAGEADPTPPQDAVAATADPAVRIVADFHGVDALLAEALQPDDSRPEAPAADGERSQPPQA